VDTANDNVVKTQYAVRGETNRKTTTRTTKKEARTP